MKRSGTVKPKAEGGHTVRVRVTERAPWRLEVSVREGRKWRVVQMSAEEYQSEKDASSALCRLISGGSR